MNNSDFTKKLGAWTWCTGRVSVLCFSRKNHRLAHKKLWNEALMNQRKKLFCNKFEWIVFLNFTEFNLYRQNVCDIEKFHYKKIFISVVIVFQAYLVTRLLQRFPGGQTLNIVHSVRLPRAWHKYINIIITNHLFFICISNE